MLDLIRAYENYLMKVKQASDNTISSYMRDIRQFADWLQKQVGLDIADASQQHISQYLLGEEAESISGATLSRRLASLKNFYVYLVSSGFLERSPVMDIHIDEGLAMSRRIQKMEVEVLAAMTGI